jgi:hypothetical protein
MASATVKDPLAHRKEFDRLATEVSMRHDLVDRLEQFEKLDGLDLVILYAGFRSGSMMSRTLENRPFAQYLHMQAGWTIGEPQASKHIAGESLAEFRDREDVRIRVVSAEDEPVGFLLYIIYPQGERPSGCERSTLYVSDPQTVQDTCAKLTTP